MVNIELDDDKQQLLINWTGDKFSDLVELAKSLDLRFNVKKKAWTGELPLLNHYIDEFSVEDSVSVDEFTKQTVEEYIKSLEEFEKCIFRSQYLKYVPELMKKQPIKDKFFRVPNTN